MVEISENGIGLLLGPKLKPNRWDKHEFAEFHKFHWSFWIRWEREKESVLCYKLYKKWQNQQTNWNLLLMLLLLVNVCRQDLSHRISFNFIWFTSMVISIPIALATFIRFGMCMCLHACVWSNTIRFSDWILLGIVVGVLIFYQFISSCFVDMFDGLVAFYTASASFFLSFSFPRWVFSISILIFHCDKYLSILIDSKS